MMYLSRLKLKPDHRATVELSLNPYLLHQAVFRAFPDVVEGGTGRILYRFDVSQEGKISLLVQSEKAPDWNKATLLMSCLEKPLEEPKIYPPTFAAGQILLFRLRANPSVKKKAENKKNGYRLGLLKEDDQINWLNRKAESGGFALVSCQIISEGISRDDKHREQRLRHFGVRFDGVLKVVNPQLFEETVKNGIGAAKGFGFGLLSVAPVRN